jgi:hypothetical protein
MVSGPIFLRVARWFMLRRLPWSNGSLFRHAHLNQHRHHHYIGTGFMLVPARLQVALILDSLRDQVCSQAARLKMVRQQHDAVWVESLCFQGINAPQNFVLRQINHGDRAIAQAI